MKSCFPLHLALAEIETIEFGKSRTFEHRLKSTSVNGVFLTRVVLEGVFDGRNVLFKLKYPQEEDEVAIPYSLFALMAAIADSVPYWNDFTQGCQSLPVSVSPGNHVELGTAKLTGKGVVEVHLLAFGR
jgi:hypothetical protein